MGRTRGIDEDSTAQGAEPFEPFLQLEIELSGPLPPIPSVASSGRRRRRAMLLISLHTRPLGLLEVEIPDNGLSEENCAQLIWQQLSDQILAHLQEDGLPSITSLSASGILSPVTPRCVEERAAFLTHAPFASVVIATRDRPDRIASCLAALLAMDYPNFEILVVDNAPSTEATADFIRQTYGAVSRVRYVRENRAGLSRARNRGALEARGEIIAFTDDDVFVDRYWLAELARAFSACDNVGCVTGLVLPAELETPAQLWLEQYGGFGKGFDRRIYDMQANRPKNPLFPYAAGAFGTGANIAVRSSVFRTLGGFDPALGSGSRAAGGEDLALFFQIIMSGYCLVYEPAAFLRHLHRREYTALRRQLYTYGVGLTAYLTAILLNHPGQLIDFARRVPAGLAYGLGRTSPKNTRKRLDYPAELTWLERKGFLMGPVAYIRSLWQERQAKS